MKITDLKCAVIGQNPLVRIVTDEGLSDYGEVESFKPYLKPYVLHVNPTGLYDLDRRPRPVAAAYRQIIQEFTGQ